MTRNYTIINYFLNNKNLYGNHMVFPSRSSLFLHPCYHSLGYSLSHQHLCFRWPTPETATTTTTGTTMGGNNQDVNPPPPPPPTLEQVLIMQAQLLQTMQQALVSMQAAPPQAPPPAPRDRLGEFQRTKPPTFSQAMEPMDADDWLKSMEKKL
jgi:hypothetical protein